MAHPFSAHSAQKTSKSRVGHIMKSGGAAHSDVAADKKLFKELMAKHEASEMKAEGKKSGGPTRQVRPWRQNQAQAVPSG